MPRRVPAGCGRHGPVAFPSIGFTRTIHAPLRKLPAGRPAHLCRSGRDRNRIGSDRATAWCWQNRSAARSLARYSQRTPRPRPPSRIDQHLRAAPRQLVIDFLWFIGPWLPVNNRLIPQACKRSAASSCWCPGIEISAGWRRVGPGPRTMPISRTATAA